MGVLIKEKPVENAITETLIKEAEELKTENINNELSIIRVGFSKLLTFKTKEVEEVKTENINSELTIFRVGFSKLLTFRTKLTIPYEIKLDLI